MDQPVNVMLEMHENLMSARTLEERNALMAEHRKTMQDALAGATLGSMNSRMPWDMATRQQMLEKRMVMMETLMQKILERLSAESVK